MAITRISIKQGSVVCNTWFFLFMIFNYYWHFFQQENILYILKIEFKWNNFEVTIKNI